MAIIGCAIGQAADSYNKLMAARVVQGFATSAFESLIISVIGYVVFPKPVLKRHLLM